MEQFFLNVFLGTDSIEKPYLNSLLGKHLANNLCKTIKKCDLFENSKEIDMDKVMQVPKRVFVFYVENKNETFLVILHCHFVKESNKHNIICDGLLSYFVFHPNHIVVFFRIETIRFCYLIFVHFYFFTCTALPFLICFPNLIG